MSGIWGFGLKIEETPERIQSPGEREMVQPCLRIAFWNMTVVGGVGEAAEDQCPLT